MSEEPSFDAIPLSHPAPGQLLAEAREARGWSVDEVAMRLKFSTRQIVALEADAYGALPGATIVRGMVRSYAKAVGLDPTPLIADLERRLSVDPFTVVSPSMHVPIRESSKKPTRLYAALSSLIVIAVVALGAQWWFEGRTPTTVHAPATTQQRVSPEEETESVPAEAPIETVPTSEMLTSQVMAPGNKRIELQFGAEAWVEVRDGEGKILMAQLNPAASQTAVEGKPPFTLVIGNANSVQVRYDGTPVDVSGASRNDVARLTLD